MTNQKERAILLIAGHGAIAYLVGSKLMAVIAEGERMHIMVSLLLSVGLLAAIQSALYVFLTLKRADSPDPHMVAWNESRYSKSLLQLGVLSVGLAVLAFFFSSGIIGNLAISGSAAPT